jgi:hypothetical protein
MEKEIVYVFPPSMEVKGNVIPAGWYGWQDRFTHITAHYMGEEYDDESMYFCSWQDESILVENERIFERV